ncbi:MAG: hypothetical protein JNN07_00600 [Verrucomicrobiales bacterium]|nr:hypothetical protein [Verrucomicrobiales bacterium]
MKTLSLSLALLSLPMPINAESPGSYVTWVSVGKEGGDTFVIKEGEAVRLISSPNVSPTAQVLLEKDGITFDLTDTDGLGIVNAEVPFVVSGPAVFRVSTGNSPTYPLTFQYLPGSADPQTTVVVPPGSAGGKVQVQASTNLVDWFSADLGTYTNLPAALFFRIDFQKISSPAK